MVDNTTCKHYEGCSAPLCPMDNSFPVAVWYADEDVCGTRPYRKERWRRIQHKISKVNKLNPVFGYFAVSDLNTIRRVSKKIKGNNPDPHRTPYNVK